MALRAERLEQRLAEARYALSVCQRYFGLLALGGNDGRLFAEAVQLASAVLKG